MEKIGVFGGTFNPVHNEHINLVKNAIKELSLDKVIVVLDNIPPHKEAILISNEQRLELLKIAFKDEKKVEISDFEIKNGGTSYTYITIEHFKNIYKEDELYLFVGGDMLKDFKTWKNPQRIIDKCTLVACRREGDEVDIEKEHNYFKNTFNKDFILLNYIGKNISSTKIRAEASLGVKIDGEPQEIEEYIEAKKLYCDKYCEFVRQTLTEKRKIHIVGVITCALRKAKENGLSLEKVRLSATLHDCAKYLNEDDYKDFVMPDGVPLPVVHAYLGAYIAEKILKIEDMEIIDAIRYHTSGRANMTKLEKLIFVADMIEEGRNYEGVDKLREAYERGLEECFRLCLKEETIHLINKKQKIYIETLNAYNYYIKEGKE